MTKMPAKLSFNLGILLFLLAMALPLLGVTGAASAAVWTNRAVYYGYFTNVNPKQGGLCEYAGCAHQGYVLNAPLGGLAVPTNIDTVPELVKFLKTYNTNGNPRDVHGSGFIVQSMLGRSGDEANLNGGQNISAADWVDLENRMNAASISWDIPWSTTRNTYMQASSLDVAQDVSGQSDNAIVFYRKDTGAPVYALFRNCANPDGNLNGLPKVAATEVASGTLTMSNSQPEVGRPLTLTATVTSTGGPPSPARTVADATISVDGPGSYAQQWNITGASALSDDGSTVTLKSPGFSPPATGDYTVTWEAKVNSVSPDEAPCSQDFRVMNYPYFEVNGGDVVAGAGIVTNAGQACGTAANNTRAGVASWNTNVAPYTAGAGSQYATFAWDFIQEFATSKGSGNQPAYLSFANNASGQVNLAAGRYGGFGKPTSCIDSWKDAPASNRQVPSPGSANVNSLDGIYMHNGPLTLSGTTISAGKKVTIYVTGDVVIADDILYDGAATGWADFSKIPVFKLVVKGTIHIGANVNRIDGAYVAVPATSSYTSLLNNYNAPAAGTISTCSNGTTILNPDTAPASMVVACNRRLEVNGSLSANQILLLRTYGSMSAGEPAELINFSPEMWLAPSQSKGIDPTYQSIVGLPPVL